MKNRGYRAPKALSYAKIEVATSRLRRLVGLDDNAPLPGGEEFFDRFLNGLTIHTSRGRLRANYYCDNLPSGCEGRAVYSPESPNEIAIELSPETYSGFLKNWSRPRFTVNHEFGHAVLHAEVLIQLGSVPHHVAELQRQATADRHPAYRDTEWQANAFAGALLVPAAGVRRVVSSTPSDYVFGVEGALQSEFDVSAPVAERRLALFKEGRI